MELLPINLMSRDDTDEYSSQGNLSAVEMIMDCVCRGFPYDQTRLQLSAMGYNLLPKQYECMVLLVEVQTSIDPTSYPNTQIGLLKYP